jgi:uncharacterized protein YbjT (DUF2867 family)
MRILVAGASGFVGSSLILQLAKNPEFEIFGLTRNANKKSPKPNIHWVGCDLFSLKDLEEALKGMDLAVYLIHSMLPSAGLAQGDFQDNDLILADNFARAAKMHNIKQIVYLGGIIPKDEALSPHLKSRLETEETLRAYGTPVTALRAPIIIGKNGSSFNIVVKLVERLPVMVLPKWTSTFSCPVALNDVVHSIAYVLGKEEYFGKVKNLLGSDTITYKELLELTATVLGRKRFFVNVPFFTLQLSRLWVSTITNTPKDLVYPLIQSLKHPMIPEEETVLKMPGYKLTGLKEAIMKGLGVDKVPSYKSILPIFRRNTLSFHKSTELKEVRSVQRLYLPPGKNAEWVGQQYLEWLPQFFKKVITVEINDLVITFKLLKYLKILELTFSPERSTPDRRLAYVTGGLLAKRPQGRGRLEFRETTSGKHVLAAIHEFKPSLPWYIYKYTQAPFHVLVMNKFGKYLENQK